MSVSVWDVSELKGESMRVGAATVVGERRELVEKKGEDGGESILVLPQTRTGSQVLILLLLDSNENLSQGQSGLGTVTAQNCYSAQSNNIVVHSSHAIATMTATKDYIIDHGTTATGLFPDAGDWPENSGKRKRARFLNAQMTQLKAKASGCEGKRLARPKFRLCSSHTALRHKGRDFGTSWERESDYLVRAPGTGHSIGWGMILFNLSREKNRAFWGEPSK
ncbi:hypothetical protein DFH08DRAFT_814751 [Mycena albidolilacea]|uniref:Uncharacterized protein n=1 Tax=Mycena albidolilacea TaxID=1033008 RepID=A0AAD6ZP39_9AGAR|nr:hypothetical protein DFH08DRAFT_814751 [Mycena albidolilacea]